MNFPRLHIPGLISCGSTFCLQNLQCIIAKNGKGVCVCNKGFKKENGVCVCNKGFKEQNGRCQDINECAVLSTTCGDQFKCINTPGSYKCECKPGYKLVSLFCQDIDECAAGFCGESAVCHNTAGSYRCQCKKGYKKNNHGLCKDVDECKETNCGEYGRCVNTIGSFNCSCFNGYFYNGTSCRDEPKLNWTEFSGLCRSASCKEKVAGRTTARICKAICATKENCKMAKFLPSKGRCSMCHKNQLRKTNKKKCTQKNRYDFFIKDIRKSTVLPNLPGNPNTTVATTVGPTIPDIAESNSSNSTNHCNEQFKMEFVGQDIFQWENICNEPISHVKWIILRLLCVHVSFQSYHKVKTPKECTDRCERIDGCVLVHYNKNASLCWLSNSRKLKPKDKCDKNHDYFVLAINECDGKKRRCHQHASCKTGKGNRYCECKFGFEGNGFSCIDINECARYKNLCGKNAHCKNTMGSYKCVCNPRFVGNGIICVDENGPHAKSFGKKTTTERGATTVT